MAIANIDQLASLVSTSVSVSGLVVLAIIVTLGINTLLSGLQKP